MPKTAQNVEEPEETEENLMSYTVSLVIEVMAESEEDAVREAEAIAGSSAERFWHVKETDYSGLMFVVDAKSGEIAEIVLEPSTEDTTPA